MHIIQKEFRILQRKYSLCVIPNYDLTKQKRVES
jgi:hypothetical protein